MESEEPDTFYSIHRDVNRYMDSHGFNEWQVVIDLDAEFSADYVFVHATIGPHPEMEAYPVTEKLHQEYQIEIASGVTPEEAYNEEVSELEQDLDDTWIRSA